MEKTEKSPTVVHNPALKKRRLHERLGPKVKQRESDEEQETYRRKQVGTRLRGFGMEPPMKNESIKPLERRGI